MSSELDLTRGLFTDVVDIRRKVFVEVAKALLDNPHDDLAKMKEETAKIPYRIIKRDDPNYRCCVHKERAILVQRVRFALGLSLWEGGLSGPVYSGIDDVLKPEKIQNPKIIRVIPEACEKCPTKEYKVTNNCRKCIAHPCSVVCPVDAISFTDTQAVIDKNKCIKCGRCEKACPYNAVTHYDRPCAAACGVDAIESSDKGTAKINYDKCVKCGMCIVACPFGAIADKSEFVQMLIAIKEDISMYAIIAPSFVGQFGPLVSAGAILKATEQIGFKGIMEVAYGADVATELESEEWYHKIYEEKQEFLGTSCCPAWVDMAKNNFPELQEYISDSYTPMVATAKFIKEKDPKAQVTFIGPCTAKKSESLREEVHPYIDYVITFEELASIFVAMDIDLADLEESLDLNHASGSGRNYAVSGGVANALKEQLSKNHPDAEVKIEKADSLSNCKKMLLLAKAKKLDANLLEGMACPSGCVGGAGIIAPIRRTATAVNKFAKDSKYYLASENPILHKGGKE